MLIQLLNVRIRTARIFLAAMILVGTICGAVSTPYSQARPNSIQLQFPDKSIGLLHVIKGIDTSAGPHLEPTIYAKAKGAVTVPAGTHFKLHLNYDGCNPEALRCLATFPADVIYNLDAGNLESFGDGALAKVCETKGLRDLTLMNTQVTDAGLKNLSKLDRLIKLQLSETEITAASIPLLVNNPNLAGIGMRLTNLRGADFAPFARAKALVSLNVAASNIDSRAIPSICKLQNLRDLCLAGNGKINDADVKKLTVLKKLESLNLKDTGITGASILTFKAFSKLKVLEVSYPPEFVKRLEREMPKVEVISANSRPYPKELFRPLH